MIVNIKIIKTPFIENDKLKLKGEILSQMNGNISDKEIWIVAFSEIKEMLHKSIQLEENDVVRFSGEYTKDQTDHFSFKIKSLISFQRKSKKEKPLIISKEKPLITSDIDNYIAVQENIPPPKRQYSDRHLKGEYYNFDELTITREDIIRMRLDDPWSMYNLGYEPLDDCLKP